MSDVLARPKDAVFYELSRVLRAAYPDSYVLETQDPAFQLHGFAYAEHCRMRDSDVAHTHWTAGWNARHAQRFASLHNGWLAVEWEGHRVTVVVAGLQGQHCRETRSYVVAPSREVAEAFFETVCRWGSDVHSEVLVFNEGRWTKSRELYESIQTTTLDGLILPAELKDEVRDNVTAFFQSETTYDRYGLPWKRGLLFLGPPGNGKTHMIKGLANTISRPVLYVRSFASRYGSSHENIDRAFERARDLAPCMLVLEDLDALVDDTNRSYFLNEMDGFESNRGLLTVATTNHPDRLDPAILERPSRFDRKFNFSLPEREERECYLTHMNARLDPAMRLSETDLARLASGATDGFSYAYLKELIVSSMVSWVRDGGARPMEEIAFAQVDALAGQMRTEMAGPARPRGTRDGRP